MSATRKVKRAALVKARKAAAVAMEQQYRAARKAGVNQAQAQTMAAFFAKSRFAQVLAWLRMSVADRTKMKTLKRLRDSLVLDWSQATPAEGPCGECEQLATRRWNGVGFDPTGELFEAKNVCPKCASEIEEMAQKEGYTMGGKA